MLQIEQHHPESKSRDLGELVTELRERNDALRYLTRWRAARESYQVQALRRSMHAITDGLTIGIPFRTGSWCIEPHLESHLATLSRALVDMPCLQVKLEGFAVPGPLMQPSRAAPTRSGRRDARGSGARPNDEFAEPPARWREGDVLHLACSARSKMRRR